MPDLAYPAGPVFGDPGDLDSHHELHLVEEARERGSFAGFGVRPECFAVVVTGEGMFHTALRGQDERFGRRVRGEPLEELRRQRVQQRQTVGTADGQHVTIRQVDKRAAGEEFALFGDDGAIVGGDACVRPVKPVLCASTITLAKPKRPKSAPGTHP